MTKVHPNALITTPSPQLPKSSAQGHVQVLTVWKKSLLFNCKGFAVFDTNGNLVFRVDNYLSSNKSDIILMDSTGKPLLTVRRKLLQWVVYHGETAVSPVLTVKKNMNILNSKLLAQVTSGCDSFRIEGSYGQRCCKVYDEKRRVVAEIRLKESVVGGVSFGVDVFRLVVQPQMDPMVGMALVIILEQMFGSR